MLPHRFGQKSRKLTAPYTQDCTPVFFISFFFSRVSFLGACAPWLSLGAVFSPSTAPLLLFLPSPHLSGLLPEQRGKCNHCIYDPLRSLPSLAVFLLPPPPPPASLLKMHCHFANLYFSFEQGLFGQVRKSCCGGSFIFFSHVCKKLLLKENGCVLLRSSSVFLQNHHLFFLTVFLVLREWQCVVGDLETENVCLPAGPDPVSVVQSGPARSRIAWTMVPPSPRSSCPTWFFSFCPGEGKRKRDAAVPEIAFSFFTRSLRLINWLSCQVSIFFFLSSFPAVRDDRKV